MQLTLIGPILLATEWRDHWTLFEPSMQLQKAQLFVGHPSTTGRLLKSVGITT